MGLFDSIKNAFKSAGSAIAKTATNIYDGAKNTVNNVGNAITSTATNVYDSAKNAVNNTYDSAKNTVNNVGNAVTNAHDSAKNTVNTAITNTANNIGNSVTDAVNSTKNKAVGGYNNFSDFFQNWFKKANNFGASIPGRANVWGNQIEDFARDTAKDTAKWAVDSFTSSIILRNPDPVRRWKCKLGPDEEALKIAGIVVQAVSLTLTAVSLAGVASVPTAIGMSVTAAGYGVSIAGGKATTIDTVNKYAQKLTGKTNSFSVEGAAKSVADILNIDYTPGWKVIEPNSEARFDKLTLSLLQQATCMTSSVDPSNPQQVVTMTIAVKNLWSGPTAGSASTYGIPVSGWESDAKKTITQFNLFNGPLSMHRRRSSPRTA